MAITPTRLAAALLSFCVCETHFISSMTMKLEHTACIGSSLKNEKKGVFSKDSNREATELWAGYEALGSKSLLLSIL